MSRTDIYAIALWLLAIPANRYLGDLAAIACGVLGIACLVVGRFHTGETGSDSILKLDVGSLPTVSAPLPWSNLESKVETTRLCLESCVVLKPEAGDLSFVAQIQNRPKFRRHAEAGQLGVDELHRAGDDQLVYGADGGEVGG